MGRIARVVAPGIPHHVTQRGNRRQLTFFGEDDYRASFALMAEWCRAAAVAIWAYCLMPNPVHLIAVPATADGLRRAIGEAHRRYTRRVNFREGWRGHLWQGRFASYPLDAQHLVAAARSIELNPVRAGLVTQAEAYPWSSAAAHLAGRDDRLVTVTTLLAMVGAWTDVLAAPLPEETLQAFRRQDRSGRPLGPAPFLGALEATLDRPLQPLWPGRKRTEAAK